MNDRERIAELEAQVCRMREIIREVGTTTVKQLAEVPGPGDSRALFDIDRLLQGFLAGLTVLASPSPCPHAADTARIDRLEAEIKREPLLLHDLIGGEHFPTHPRGLGLLQGGRTLRQAIDDMEKGGGE